MARVCVLAFCALAACTPFPELETEAATRMGDTRYPRLVPLDTLLEGPAPRADAAEISQITARADGLASRAQSLSTQRPAAQADADRVRRLRQRAAELRKMR